MKFISTKLGGSQRLECTAPFDIEFIHDVEICDSTVFFDYAIRDFQTGFPVNVSRAYFAVQLTNDNVFTWATIYIDGDNVLIRRFLNDWDNGWGNLECEVELSEAESKKLMLFLLKNFLK